ncbi:S8 family peptidase [Flavobacterium aquicola]|uniref:Subtilase family protein n=1 Tax=Flavobacterium aquicola TaxID=1682742 RepID=A0A3E0EP68_9FLAO|nr:S8 family peptidase [Flavobacterium aquicola]REG99149.1 subtilase family protein [Flavobacterium aquicola]
MEKFPHLKLAQKITGSPRLFGGGDKSQRSKENIENRRYHANHLNQQTNQLKQLWDENIVKRQELGLPDLNPNIVPVFLKVDPSSFDVEAAFAGFNINVISENEDGYIIGASFDGLQGLREKINRFLEEKGRDKDQASQLWEILSEKKWRTEYILSEALLREWDTIIDEELYIVDVAIACYKQIMQEPDPKVRGYDKKIQEYRSQLIAKDELFAERQSDFERFVFEYSAEFLSSYLESNDSFSCRIEIAGKGLKDIVINYPFIFEVTEACEVGLGEINSESEFNDYGINTLVPTHDSPSIVVIDSGIQEDHNLLIGAIDVARSRSYLKDVQVADFVAGGGHGTRVAGAILYPNGVTGITEDYQLPFFIRNSRVLDHNRKLPLYIYPPILMTTIVNDNRDCKIFNLSISTKVPCRIRHMSAWASSIDTLIHREDILFVISVGNITARDISHYFAKGDNYPDYLFKPENRIANPAQSSFALVVGSINHSDFNDGLWASIGNVHEVSPFSRVGTGIWGMIKPDVVEFGGGLVKMITGNLVSTKSQISPELIRSTLHGGGHYGNDDVGTSYATPKVAHIVGQLLKLYPDEGMNLIRAFVVQGARLPNMLFNNPTFEGFRQFGYGVPSLERVVNNTPHRVTFYNTNTIQAEEGHIFSLKIPESLRSQGDDYSVLVEVTLSYTAETRRTRQKTKSYLATWLDWNSSKKGETYRDYEDFAMKEIKGTVNHYDNVARNLLPSWDWKLGERNNWGQVRGVRRNDSTLQKDWTIIRSFDLTEEICFSVRGHKGWDKNKKDIPYAFVVTIEILDANVEIYEAIRIENEVEIET